MTQEDRWSVRIIEPDRSLTTYAGYVRNRNVVSWRAYSISMNVSIQTPFSAQDGTETKLPSTTTDSS